MRVNRIIPLLVLALLATVVVGVRAMSTQSMKARCMAADCATIAYQGQYRVTDAHSLSLLKGLLDGKPGHWVRCGAPGTVKFWVGGSLLGEIEFLIRHIQGDRMGVLVSYEDGGSRHVLMSENAEAAALLQKTVHTPCGCPA